MPVSDRERIFGTLEDSGARIFVVGGVAVGPHGHLRSTADLDLLLALDAPNIDAALFVAHPLASEAAWPRRPRADFGGVVGNVASLGNLIETKRRAGRPQDLEDVARWRRSRALVQGALIERYERPGWEQHREARRRGRLRLPYAERLRWLDQAKRVSARALEAAKKCRKRTPAD